MKYTKEELIEEINNFIIEHNRYPTASDMRVKYNYHSINAYRETFGSFTNAILEMERSQIDDMPGKNNIIIDPNKFERYTVILQTCALDLAIEHSNVDITIISEILMTGYNVCMDAVISNAKDIILQELYL